MQDGDTALIRAIVNRHAGIAKILLKRGANKDHQNKVRFILLYYVGVKLRFRVRVRVRLE